MRIVLALLVFASVPSLADENPEQIPPVIAPGYEELYTRAELDFTDNRFRAAIDDLLAAYRVEPRPIVLLQLARCHRRLGHDRQTVDYYNRFRNGQALTPEWKAEIDDVLRIIAGTTPYKPTYKVITVPHQGMLIGGASLFAAAYTVAALAGGDAADRGGAEYRYGNSAVAGGLLFIPFVGPFASAGAFRDPRWAGPWAAVNGVSQLVGLSLMIASRYRPQRVRILQLGAP